MSRDQSLLTLLADVLDVTMFEKMTKYERIIHLILYLSFSSFFSFSSTSRALLLVFEASGRSLHLLRWAIAREVSNSSTATTLFREDGLTCRLISTFSRQAGLPYLRTVLHPLVKKIAQTRTNYEASFVVILLIIFILTHRISHLIFLHLG